MAQPVLSQGEVWWADLAEPVGSVPGWRRPVVIVQCDAINASRIATALCVPLTSNLMWARAPGNVMLAAGVTGLDRDSVANVSLTVALDRSQLIEQTGRLSARLLDQVLTGIGVIIGR